MDKLHDTDFYKRTGLKRKKGYLFYGLPGTGKTATVMAMSNYDRRHIIEVPLSRIKTNNELEYILTMSHINGIKFNPDNIIILFDEIDIGTKLNREKQLNTDDLIDVLKSDSKEKIHKVEMEDYNSDKLNLGTLLSRLDGIGNYAGLIIVGTSNNICNIDKAMYRDGRLNLIKFDNATYADIKQIIEKYYQLELNQKQLEIIKQLDMKMSHAKLRMKLEHYDDVNVFIDVLNKQLIEDDSQTDSPKVNNKAEVDSDSDESESDSDSD